MFNVAFCLLIVFWWMNCSHFGKKPDAGSRLVSASCWSSFLSKWCHCHPREGSGSFCQRVWWSQDKHYCSWQGCCSSWERSQRTVWRIPPDWSCLHPEELGRDWSEAGRCWQRGSYCISFWWFKQWLCTSKWCNHRNPQANGWHDERHPQGCHCHRGGGQKDLWWCWSWGFDGINWGEDQTDRRAGCRGCWLEAGFEWLHLFWSCENVMRCLCSQI